MHFSGTLPFHDAGPQPFTTRQSGPTPSGDPSSRKFQSAMGRKLPGFWRVRRHASAERGEGGSVEVCATSAASSRNHCWVACCVGAADGVGGCRSRPARPGPALAARWLPAAGFFIPGVDRHLRGGSWHVGSVGHAGANRADSVDGGEVAVVGVLGGLTGGGVAESFEAWRCRCVGCPAGQSRSAWPPGRASGW